MLLAVVALAADPKAETVMVTCVAKPGFETELGGILKRHWDAVKALYLIADSPHMTLKRIEGGKTTYFEIFTWKDRSIPDHAPAPIQAIWSEMNRYSEKLEIAEVTVLP
jgi:hypothetical protein